MNRPVVAGAVFLCLYVLQSVAGAQGVVVVGQNANGQNVVTQVIELKFMDPYYAAELLQALGYPGTAIPVGGQSMGRPVDPGRSQGNRPRGYGAGSYDGGGYGYRDNGGGRAQGRNSYGDGYGGYQQTGRTNQQYPGYQSPYGNGR